MKLEKEHILEALSHIRHPETGKDIVSENLIEGIRINDTIVSISLQIDPAQAEMMEKVRQQCEVAVAKIPAVTSVRAIMTAKKQQSSHSHGTGPQHTPAPTPQPMKGAKFVVAVASGKGGVGKSTTSVNMAYALSKMGLKVGLADCDIYGPSASVLLGMKAQPQFTDDDRILPVDCNGVKAISMSFLVDPDTAAVWRGPMVIGAVQQFLTGVAWDIDGELDILITDLPPGTGDVQLTLAQTVNVDGAVIVSTPQDLALIDARKAFDMFTKTGTPVLGVVENMSHFVCPHCGETTELFGHGGARKIAEQKGLPFLGEIPLHIDIRTSSDAGAPIVISQPDSAHAKQYEKIAAEVMHSLIKKPH
ncbi:MAG: Mrp/NBP35 family ATP-binding protein [bacterium]